jgi:sortase A
MLIERSWNSRYLPVVLLTGGAVGLLWVGAEFAGQSVFQREQVRVLERALERPPETAAPRPPTGGLVGKLEIPRVALSVMVAEGDDEATLDRAVGHLPDTPLPWEPGNSALAGHRDTFFRPLKDVRVGDEVRLTSAHGTFVYRVSEAFVTTPDDVGVLASRGKAELTFVTCYPFNFIGPAPKRYIVRAERLPAERSPERTPVPAATARMR